MSNEFLNFAAPVSFTISPAEVSAGYLKNVLIVSVGTGNQAGDQTKIQQAKNADDLKSLYATSSGMEYLFTEGVEKVYCACIEKLATLKDVMEDASNPSDYFTVLIDGVYSKDEISTVKVKKGFRGVVAFVSDKDEELEAFKGVNGIQNKCLFKAVNNGYANYYEAFGKLLTQPEWTNMQYWVMSTDDGIKKESELVNCFDKRIVCVGEEVDDSTGNTQNLLYGMITTEHPIIQPYLFELLALEVQNAFVTWTHNNAIKGNVDMTTVNCKHFGNYAYDRAKTKFMEDHNYFTSLTPFDVTPSDEEQYIINTTLQINDMNTIIRNKINIDVTEE